ncbi:MAG: aminoglycoside phosphotransferase family protein [Armatimonadetes bacterium]|nr:aminoglycoside phosphotransferase family protein [Armatimonadota bacterium]
MDAAEFRAFRVPREHVERFCRAHGLAEPRAFERIAKGEVSASFSLDLLDGTAAVLKVFCRSQDPSAMVRQEATLRYLRAHSDVPVPAWTLLDISGREVPYPCLLMERLGGVDADELWEQLERGRAGLLLRRCGAALRALHRAPLEQAEELFAGGVFPPEVWADRTAEAFDHAVDGLARQGWADPALLAAARAAWEQGKAALYAPFEPVLLHRDYQLWNLRVDPDTLEVIGVLDLDAAGFGPAVADVRDLELNVFLPRPWLRAEFWRGYGCPPPSGIESERLRMSALARALSLLCAYWGPTANLDAATVWLLLSPWTEDAEG